VFICAPLTIGTGARHVFHVDSTRASHIAEIDRPTFLTRIKNRVYGVSEVGAGKIFSLADGTLEKTPGTLTLTDTQGSPVEDGLAAQPIGSGGAHPCHIAANEADGWVYVANYSDGIVRAVHLDDEGGFGDVIDLPHSGHGVDTQRQTGPHAHFCGVVNEQLVVADLGTDHLRVYPLDRGKPDGDPHVVKMAAGSGPRHFTHHDGLLYVAGELDGTITVVDPATWQVQNRQVAASVPGSHMLSHIEAFHDHIVVGVRGANIISVLSPNLDIIQQIPTTLWPRHFAFNPCPDHPGVVVAGERGNEIVHHPITFNSGGFAIGEIDQRLGVPTPMFLGVGEQF